MSKKEFDEYQKRLDFNQKKFITEFIERLKSDDLKDVANYRAVQYEETTFRNYSGKIDLFSVIENMLYEYCAKSIYKIAVSNIKKDKELISIQIDIGDFYTGSMMSRKSVITIKL